jgi:uroporphyrinogen decarboxylase
MTFRERYIESLLFGKPDRIPLIPGGPRESTLSVWHTQGLPANRDYYQVMLKEIGIRPMSVEVASPGVSFAMLPCFEEKVLEHRDGHYIVQDWMGNVTEISDQYDYTYIRAAKDFVTRKWHSFPVVTHADWERMKERYVINTPGRFPDDLHARCVSIKYQGSLVSISFPGIFWQLREWCGFEPLCIKFIEEPDFVREMIDFWREWVLSILEGIHQYITPDCVIVHEDMAYKAHSMISPDMTREFMLPVYREWVSALYDFGCPIVGVDSDGYIGELIPIWLEAGFNMCTPLEVAAHNDIVKYRNDYGTKMAFSGGIDKRAMAAGGKVLAAELERVIPLLLKDGGFIPQCDHGVPSDVSWPNFIEYCRLLAQYCGWI